MNILSVLLSLILLGCGSGKGDGNGDGGGGGDPNTTGGGTNEQVAFVSRWVVGDGGTVFLPLVEKTADMENEEKFPFLKVALPDALRRVDYQYEFVVDWGDGTTSEVTAFDDPDTRHTYAQGGVYTIKITGQLEAMRSATHKEKTNKSGYLQAVDELGDVGWKALFHTFAKQFQLTAVAGGDTSDVDVMIDVFSKSMFVEPDVSKWDTAKVVSMRGIFAKTAANPDVSKWDTSTVSDMSDMFAHTTTANPDVSKWDTANVTDMSGMFALAHAAKPDVSEWNTSKVTNMSWMFGAASATPDVSKWDTASVTDMNRMFAYASADPDVSKWNTANVVNMVGMFEHTSVANPDVSNWNTASVTDMSRMFMRASAAAPDVSNWDVRKVTRMINMFKGARKAQPDMSRWLFSSIKNMNGMLAGHTFSPASYNALLGQIFAHAQADGVTLDAGKSTTTDGTYLDLKRRLQGRDWVIYDGNNQAPPSWEIIMDMVIEASADNLFNVTVRVEDAYGNPPTGSVTVLVALDERGRLNGTTEITTTNGVAQFTGLSPKNIQLPAGFSFPRQVKVMGELETVATLHDGKTTSTASVVVLNFK